jgi:uridine kinase
LLIKLPLLLADIAIFYILKSWLNHKNTLKLLLLYWFSPVLIYISYIHGQLDSIPISLLFISLFLLFRNSLNASAIFLAFAMATKTVIAAIFPILLIFLISQRLSNYQILKFFSISLLAFLLINAPYLYSDAFISMVFNNQKQGAILISSINFGGVSLYMLPLAYCGILLKGLSLKTLSKDTFVMFLGFCFAILLIFTNPSAGWYFWLLPFLFYFYVKSSSKGFLLVFFLQFAYILYFMLQENVDFFISSNELKNLIPVNLKNDVLQIFPLGQDVITNLTFTLMQCLLFLNCYWIYIHGLNKYTKHKITSIPLLIGIGGDSGSGKTTLSNALVGVFSQNKSTQLHGDDSHRWERDSKNWSQHTHLDPKANKLHKEPQVLKNLLNGQTILRQKYNHDTGKFDKPLALSAGNIVIYEGLHPFFLKRQRDLFDMKIFLNPSNDINTAWKVNRDIRGRGKTKKDVLDQIHSRAGDSESYIQTQLKFADMIIEPILLEESKDYGYKIIFPNSFPMDEIYEKLYGFPDLQIHHEFLNEDNQTLTISGDISSEELDLIAQEFIQGLQELGISKPIWPKNAFGVIILIISYFIFEESEYARE